MGNNPHKSYIEHVRNLPCCVGGEGHVDPHHLKAIGMGRNRVNLMWEHFTVIPLSRSKHTEIEQIGVAAFEEKYQIDVYKFALHTLAKWIHEN
jgi:hypothetical protein